jgi:cyanophycinase-like exopeptidase
LPRPARTELSEADERRLTEAVALFGLPKAEVVRRLIRASVQAGPALSAENTRAVVELASQVRVVGRNLSQVLKAIHRGQAVRIEDTEPVWRELHEVIAAINDELTEMTVAYGSKLRREAKLILPEEIHG